MAIPEKWTSSGCFSGPDWSSLFVFYLNFCFLLKNDVTKNGGGSRLVEVSTKLLPLQVEVSIKLLPVRVEVSTKILPQK